MTNMEKLRVLELYCGIGGMHYALSSCNLSHHVDVIAAIDINPLANTVYKHNFPATNHLEKNLDSFSIKQLNKMKFDVLVMSPPCQPFTRVGLKKDVDDPRCKSFLNLLQVLPQLERPPRYILLENVKGFETSEACKLFLGVLKELKFHIQPFLLSPKQIKIPNSRLRYYMIARSTSAFNEKWFNSDKILEYFPPLATSDEADFKEESSCHPLTSYMENEANKDESLMVSDKTRSRYESIMDIVTPNDSSSTCFTKAYTNYCEGTGSVLTGFDPQCSTSLRYFSPREVANLMGFPKNEFHFPDSLTNKQRYRLLGNSLNVSVVSHLMSLLLSDLS